MHELQNIFSDKRNTQLMRQSVALLGIQYIKVGELFLLHSYYEDKGTHSVNPQFQAPAQVHKVERNGDWIELTIKALKDSLDKHAVGLVRTLAANEMEISYSHLLPKFISPRIKDGDWDNWSFAYSLTPHARLEKRRARTKALCTRLYRCLAERDFRGKSILFLGCGDGDEIECFLNSFDTDDSRIVGIDLSSVAISNCRRLKSSSKNTQLSFVQGNFDEISQFSHDYFDLILAIGVIDRETLSFANGHKLLREIRGQLNFGELLCRAYSFELFSAQNYHDMGYEVLATCQPQLVFTQHDNFFYLLKKSSVEKAGGEIEDLVAKQSLEFWGGEEK